jgi:uncharacterized protein (DUF2141 family)
MKTVIILFSLIALGETHAQGRIEVVVTNIKGSTGHIRIGLFTNETDFLEKPVAGKEVKVSGTKAVVTFEGLSSGNYAVSVYHDENSNGELDTNVMGIPKEGFAFGNNAMGMFGPPSFEKAKIYIDGNSVLQEIALKYF